jgi:DNA-binding XRE family transcriptional regulator
MVSITIRPVSKPTRRPPPRFASLSAYVDTFPRSVSQREIAERLGIADSALSQYLNGRTIPNRETALRLSREFGIDLEGLLDPPTPRAVSA